MTVKANGQPKASAAAVDEFTPIRHPSRVLQSFDELAPIGDKSDACTSNRYSVLAGTEDKTSGMTEVPIREFIRPPTKRQERRFKETAKKFAKTYVQCINGCKCEDQDREDFPHLSGSPQDEADVLNQWPGTFTDAKFMATIAELDSKVEKSFIDHGKIIGDAPARSEVAVWGHKGSSARKVPASSEIAVWGHKGSSAKSAASYTSSHREHGGEKVVAPNASKVDDPACNSPVTSVLHSNKSVARPGHSSDRIQTNYPSLTSPAVSCDGSPLSSRSPVAMQPSSADALLLKAIPELLQNNEKLNDDQVMQRLRILARALEDKIALDYWTTEEGQQHLEKLAEKGSSQLSIFDYAPTTKASLLPMTDPNGEWHEIELTVDTGCRDTWSLV